MAEICKSCGRPISSTDDDYVAGNGEKLCIQVAGGGGYLLANCEEYTIKRLRSEVATLKAKLEAARKVVEAAKGMRATVPVHSGGDCVDTEPFDAALDELEKFDAPQNQQHQSSNEGQPDDEPPVWGKP